MAADGPNSEDVASDPPHDPGANIAIGQIILGAVVGIILGVLASHFVHPVTRLPPPPPRTTHYHYAEDGRMDEEWDYKNGRLVSHKRDRNHDGVFDNWAYYDAAGNLARVEEDNNFDGKPDEFWTYSHNEITGMERDLDFNGVPDEFWIYRLHLPQQMDIKPNGAKFSTVRQFFSNGVVTEIWTGGDSNGNFKEAITYDAMFNPVRTNILFHPLLSTPGH